MYEIVFAANDPGVCKLLSLPTHIFDLPLWGLFLDLAVF